MRPTAYKIYPKILLNENDMKFIQNTRISSAYISHFKEGFAILQTLLFLYREQTQFEILPKI